MDGIEQPMPKAELKRPIMAFSGLPVGGVFRKSASGGALKGQAEFWVCVIVISKREERRPFLSLCQI
jgi:hypothetical protein